MAETDVFGNPKVDWGAIDDEWLVLTQDETEALIKQATSHDELALPWGAAMLRLLRVDGNEWAVKALARGRRTCACGHTGFQHETIDFGESTRGVECTAVDPGPPEQACPCAVPEWMIEEIQT